MTKTTMDGAAAARRAIATLGVATCAETSSATLEEESSKVDVKVSFKHAFLKKKPITYHCQIKGGASYRSHTKDQNRIILRLDKDTVETLSYSGSNALILWVPPKPSKRLYWYAFDPRVATRSPVKIPRTNTVSPSIRYHLSRIAGYSQWTPKVPRQDIALGSDSAITRRAKEAFLELKNQPHFNPLFGKLVITRAAWRHITRPSKVRHRRIVCRQSNSDKIA